MTTASIANGRDDFAFRIDHQTDHVAGYMGDTPDTIQDADGAKTREQVAQTPQLPPFVTEDFTPRYNATGNNWSLVPKETNVKFLADDVAEVWAHQQAQPELQARSTAMADHFEKIIFDIGQWSAMGLVRSNLREQSRSMASGVRTAVSAYSWSARLIDNNDDTAPADSLAESAQTQIEDAVVVMLAILEAAHRTIESETDLGFQTIDWHRASRDALSFEGMKHAKRNADALNPTAAVERKRSSARAALGLLKGVAA